MPFDTEKFKIPEQRLHLNYSTTNSKVLYGERLGGRGLNVHFAQAVATGALPERRAGPHQHRDFKGGLFFGTDGSGGPHGRLGQEQA